MAAALVATAHAYINAVSQCLDDRKTVGDTAAVSVAVWNMVSMDWYLKWLSAYMCVFALPAAIPAIPSAYPKWYMHVAKTNNACKIHYM